MKKMSFQKSLMEKYYLKINGQSAFIAIFIIDNPNIVHNKPLEEGHGKFLQNTTFAGRALNRDPYNADIHCPGLYLIQHKSYQAI